MRQDAKKVVGLLLVALALEVPVAAQKARWNELNAQGKQLYEQGKYAEAIPLAQESIRVAEATFGSEHRNVAASLDNLAGLYEKQGRYADAEPLYKRALAIDEKALGPNHPDVAEVAENLARTLRKLGRGQEAKGYEEQAAKVREKRK